MKEKKFSNKLKNVLKIAIILVVVFSASIIMHQDKSHADAGYHSSYSGGSSSHSSSSHSSSHRSSSSSSYSGSSSSHSSSSSSVASIGEVIFIIIIITIIIIISSIINSGKNKVKNIIKEAIMNNEQAINTIKKHIPNFDVNKFLSNGYDIYVQIEEAWMNFELDKVRNCMTDEMFNMYESQLTSMEMKGEQNIMKEFKLLNSAITNASIQNDMMQVTTKYVIEFYDYIINKSTKKVVRGDSKRKIRMTYEMTFIEKLGKQKLDKCPNCGAPIDMNSAGICEYCNSKIVSDNTEWIMSKKVSLRQENL